MKGGIDRKSVGGKKLVIKSPFPECKEFSALPINHQHFVLEYLKDYNGTKAAIAAKFSAKTARSKAAQLLAKVNIQAALSEIVGKIFQGEVADQQEIKEFLTVVMRGKITDLVSWSEDNGLIFTSDSKDLTDKQSRLLKKLKVKEKTSPAGDFTETETTFELHDPLRAAEMLGKDLGMFKSDERIGDMNIQVNIINFNSKDFSGN